VVPAIVRGNDAPADGRMRNISRRRAFNTEAAEDRSRIDPRSLEIARRSVHGESDAAFVGDGSVYGPEAGKSGPSII
jgi:hypothetical protein